MFKKIGLILFLMLSFQAFGQDSTANNKVTASLSKTCNLAIDDLNFGDVTYAAMSGTGDVTSSTNLKLRCTKNAATSFATNRGLNGTGGSWSNSDLNVVFYNPANPSVKIIAAQSPLFDKNAFIANAISSNQVNSNKTTNLTGYSQTYCGPVSFGGNHGYCLTTNGTYIPPQPSTNWTFKLVYSNFSEISVGTPAPGSTTSNMVSGVEKIPYTMSTTSNMQTLLSGSYSNPLTYTRNDGEWQTFPLYGKANVKQAKPGTYIDTNTVIVNF